MLLKGSIRLIEIDTKIEEYRKIIDERKLQLDYHISNLSNAIKMQVISARGTLSNLAGRLNALSPLSVLSRGYSITLDNHKNILKSINELTVNDNINITMNDGNVNCTVNSISERVNMD